MVLAPADYIFSLELIDPKTGLYSILGVTTDEAQVKKFIENWQPTLLRVQVFTLGQLEGPIQTIISIDEFMEFQK